MKPTQTSVSVLRGSALPPLGGGAAVLLRSSPQVHQQPVLERVDGLVGVQPRKSGLTLSLGLGVDGGERQEVVLVAEPPDSPNVQERPLRRYLYPKHTSTHGEDESRQDERERGAY